MINDKIAAKTSGKGSHGSNFNSSASTFPAAPIGKLSDVQNPQKYMTFRYANRHATKIQEIQLFKNLQELDISGNQLQEQVKELSYLNFLKRLNLSNNKINEPWIIPQSIEILNISQNFIKIMPEEVCKKLKNISTIDISSNKLESLENFQYMRRIKRLLAKNNFVRELTHIEGVQNIFELDLEANAIDSHKDFLKFIQNKNDLIVVNLSSNPLLVDVQTIERFNEDLI
jgi:Leucine-rich repeat (LRR) protein